MAGRLFSRRTGGRRAFAMVAVAALVCLRAAGGEAVRVPMLDGLCAVTAPDDWKVTPDDVYRATILTDDPLSGCSLVIAPPNPALNANQLASMELTSLALALGGQEVIEATVGDFKGHPRMRVHFCAPMGEGYLVGLMHLITVGDYVIMATATAPDALFDAFIADAEQIMNSYEIDVEALPERAGEFRAIGEKLRDDTIREFLGPTADDREVERYRIEDRIGDALGAGMKKAG